MSNYLGESYVCMFNNNEVKLKEIHYMEHYIN